MLKHPDRFSVDVYEPAFIRFICRVPPVEFTVLHYSKPQLSACFVEQMLFHVHVNSYKVETCFTDPHQISSVDIFSYVGNIDIWEIRCAADIERSSVQHRLGLFLITHQADRPESQIISVPVTYPALTNDCQLRVI